MDWSLPKKGANALERWLNRNILEKASKLNPELSQIKTKLLDLTRDTEMEASASQLTSSSIETLGRKHVGPRLKKVKTNTHSKYSNPSEAEAKAAPRSGHIAADSSNNGNINSKAYPQKSTSEKIDARNILCPIPGCGNWGGRGYR